MGLKLTAKNFDKEVRQSDTPVLVDFYADWCGPCKMMSPLVDELAQKYAGKVKVGKVNVDEEQELAGEFGVMSIPAFVVFKDGQKVKSAVGGMDMKSLEEMINV